MDQEDSTALDTSGDHVVDAYAYDESTGESFTFDPSTGDFVDPGTGDYIAYDASSGEYREYDNTGANDDGGVQEAGYPADDPSGPADIGDPLGLLPGAPPPADEGDVLGLLGGSSSGSSTSGASEPEDTASTETAAAEAPAEASGTTSTPSSGGSSSDASAGQPSDQQVMNDVKSQQADSAEISSFLSNMADNSHDETMSLLNNLRV